MPIKRRPFCFCIANEIIIIKDNFIFVVQFLAYLLRDLSKVIDESYGCVFLQRIVYIVYVDLSLVEQMMEDVDGIDGRLSLLLAAEDQIYPLVEMRTDVITLQCLIGTNEPIKDPNR